jgi:hypothetical protein
MIVTGQAKTAHVVTEINKKLRIFIEIIGKPVTSNKEIKINLMDHIKNEPTKYKNPPKKTKIIPKIQKKNFL